MLQLRWNARRGMAELIHADGRTVLVPESKLTTLDGSFAALIHNARHNPAQSVRVPSTTNARGVTRKVYTNSLTD